MSAFFNWFNQTRRAYFYRLALAIQPLLIAMAVTTDETAALWLGVAAAVLANGVAVLNTKNTRAWFYGILLALQPLAVIYNIANEQESILWVGIIAAIMGGGLATDVTATPYSIEATAANEAKG